MKKQYDSCVMKRDWQHYKTCNECGIKKVCSMRLNWRQRLIESIMVGWRRWRINRKLRRTFGNVSHSQIKRVLGERKILHVKH